MEKFDDNLSKDYVNSDNFKKLYQKTNDGIKSSGAMESINDNLKNTLASIKISFPFDGIDTRKLVDNEVLESLTKYAQEYSNLMLYEDKTDLFLENGWFPIKVLLKNSFNEDTETIDEYMTKEIDNYVICHEKDLTLINNQYFKEALLSYEKELYLASSLSSYASIENILNYMFLFADKRNKNLFKSKKSETKDLISSEEFEKELSFLLSNLKENQKSRIIKDLKSYYFKNRNNLSHGKHKSLENLKDKNFSNYEPIISKKDSAKALNAFLFVFYISQSKEDLIHRIKHPTPLLEDFGVSINQFYKNNVGENVLSKMGEQYLNAIEEINDDLDKIKEKEDNPDTSEQGDS